MTVDPGIVDWRERTYLSQFSRLPLTFTVYVGGVPADPDGSTVTGRLLTGKPDVSESLLSTYTAAREGPGTYVITPSSADTQVPGYAELDWSYTISGQPQQY